MRIIAYILYILNAFALVRIAILFGSLVDSLSNANLPLFKENVIMMLVYALASLILPVLAYRIAFKEANKTMVGVKNKKFNYDFTNRVASFNLVDYSQNLETFYSGQLMSRYNFVNILSTFIFTSISIIAIDPRIFVIAFIFSALPLLIPLLGQEKLKGKSEDFVLSSESYLNFVKDKLEGKDEIVRYGGKDWAGLRHEAESSRHEDTRESFKLFNTLNNVVSEGIGSLGQICILLVGGYFVFRSILTVGDIITLLQLMNYLAGPVVAIISIYTTYISSKPVKERLVDTIESHPKEEIRPLALNKNEIALALEGLSFFYGDKMIFDNISYNFLSDKTYLIRGKSGSGKSTLLKILAGQIDDYQGRVLLYGRDIRSLPEESIYSNISYVGQETHIFDDTVRDNILIGKPDEGSKAGHIINNLDLDLGLEEKLGEDRLISGGEAARIGVGRFLADPHDIIILDEHTSGLNEDLAIKITKEIIALGKTVICVSHTESKEFKNLFDQCLDLEDF